MEAFDAAGMTESIRNGVRTDLSSVGLFADGAAVRCVGTETFNICRNLVDGMILVSTDEICAAIKDVFEDTRSVLEPAGALSVAGIKKYMNSNSKSFDINPGTIIALCSGANMNFERLRFVSERADIGENKEVLMSVIIPEQPGTFYKLFKCVYPLKVTEFIYRYEDTDEAHVIMAFRVGDAINRTQEVDQVFDKIKSNGFTPNDLSNNEMAKAHGRFFGGGRKKVPNERLFRFQFPERPGELDRFLGLIEGRSVEMKWNVSLWHHRNLGGDFGHLMLGIQVGNETMKEFDQFIKSIQYPTQEETFNAIYRDFIG